eukprot:CAMPEP_0116155934 /NCGR_PEP_ID=MMETSP0329-20121206/22569_1 /TAXON_ID=697910 /ORGANISM="Pseudo-nitzschia arenysensis, Strain B593" /LENGTH=319 /DNA_ID=CAMNT_0003652995 /DNA_START=214 /DNA_END=1173 /DNA_ORIENTATION=-
MQEKDPNSFLDNRGKDLIDRAYLLNPDGTPFRRFCDNNQNVLGPPGSPLRRSAQKYVHNKSSRDQKLLNSPEYKQADRIRKHRKAMSSRMKWTESWANGMIDVECYELDPDEGKNHGPAQSFIVGGVFVSNRTVDKFCVQMTIEDIQDLDNYSAQLERDGKGIFITMPRAPKFWYKDFEQFYDGGVEVDVACQAHGAQAVKIQESEDLMNRVIYYKFPGDIECNNSYFNEECDGNSLETKYVAFFKRELPLAFQEAGNDGEGEGDVNMSAKNALTHQFIARIGWECVLSSSIAKVQGGKKDSSAKIREAMAKMKLKTEG